jgi:hypothetical protein
MPGAGHVSPDEGITIFRFGVLQLRVDRVERLHLQVIAFEVYYFNILQDNVHALFTWNKILSLFFA